MTTAEIKALVERLEDPSFKGPMQHLRDWSELDRLHDQAATALRSFMDGGWRTIAEYEGCGPALVSTAPDSPRELFSEPASAFRDVTGIWRCLGSIGGYAELALQPTHFRALPKQPAEMCRDRR